MEANLNNIWVLTDYRKGNSAQSIAIAEELGIGYETKYIEYNFIAKLPNFLLGKNAPHIKSVSKTMLIADSPPKLIISSGRRTAKVAEYLKKLYPDVKIIQIMKPNISQEIFDLIILPQHDVFSAKPKCKVIRTIGALNNIKSKISKYKALPRKFISMKSFIGVLIGGDTKEYRFTKKDATQLCDYISNAASYNDKPALITFSRRTPKHVKKLFYKNLTWPNIIYDPTIDQSENPYIGILKFADSIILTCDSVSMISETASSGKPLYVYSPQKFTSKKHKYLLQQLVDLEIAKSCSATAGKMTKYKYKPLDELSKIVQYIKKNIL